MPPEYFLRIDLRSYGNGLDKWEKTLYDQQNGLSE